LRVIGHVRALSGVFLRRANVDQRLAGRRVVFGLLEERPYLFIRPLRRLVAGLLKARNLGLEWTAFLLPLDAPAVEQLRVGEAE